MSKKPLIRWPDDRQLHFAFASQFLRYDCQTGKLFWKQNKGRARAGDEAGNRMPNGYIQIVIAQKNFRAHRVCWLLHYGYWPNNHIDHIDGNPSNNAISNLRVVSQHENMRNISKRKDNKSGHTGVSWCSERQLWTARIKAGPDLPYLYLGRFANIDDAIKARLQAGIELGFHPNHGRNAIRQEK